MGIRRREVAVAIAAFAATTVMATALSALAQPQNESSIKGKPMIYELRVYRCLPGRLPALINRFANVTLKLWEKHGIKQAGFWTTLVGPSSQELTYMLVWESLADREKKWAAFAADPEWHAKRAESQKDGPIVADFSNQLLTPTAFSSVK